MGKLGRGPRTFRQLVRSAGDRVVDLTAPTLAGRLYRLSDRVAYLPFRREVVDIPEALVLDGRRMDIVADLAEYTQLPEDEVRAALRRRSGLSFRNEWWSTPARLRRDHWFYLSSKSYLFGNAVHFPDPTFPERIVVPFVPTDATVLDFGGGAGGLTLMLAAHGFETWYADVNALQRDFVRFRIRKHRLEERIRVIDWWEELPRGGFDAVIAIDVLEHLPDGREDVKRLIDSLGPRGVLVEDSPFVVNTANPMHHKDFGLAELLGRSGFAVVHRAESNTRVWQRTRETRT